LDREIGFLKSFVFEHPLPPAKTMTVSRGLLARAAVALLLLLSFHGTTAAAVQDLAFADEDLMKASPLTVAQCRAGCLHKVSDVTLCILY